MMAKHDVIIEHYWIMIGRPTQHLASRKAYSLIGHSTKLRYEVVKRCVDRPVDCQQNDKTFVYGGRMQAGKRKRAFAEDSPSKNILVNLCDVRSMSYAWALIAVNASRVARGKQPVSFKTFLKFKDKLQFKTEKTKKRQGCQKDDAESDWCKTWARRRRSAPQLVLAAAGRSFALTTRTSRLRCATESPAVGRRPTPWTRTSTLTTS